MALTCLIEEAVMTATVKARTKGKGKPLAESFFLLQDGHCRIPLGDAQMVIVEYRPPVEETRAAMAAMRERMKNDHRKGDAVKFLREFRDNPRGG